MHVFSGMHATRPIIWQKFIYACLMQPPFFLSLNKRRRTGKTRTVRLTVSICCLWVHSRRMWYNLKSYHTVPLAFAQLCSWTYAFLRGFRHSHRCCYFPLNCVDNHSMKFKSVYNARMCSIFWPLHWFLFLLAKKKCGAEKSVSNSLTPNPDRIMNSTERTRRKLEWKWSHKLNELSEPATWFLDLVSFCGFSLLVIPIRASQNTKWTAYSGWNGLCCAKKHLLLDRMEVFPLKNHINGLLSWNAFHFSV